MPHFFPAVDTFGQLQENATFLHSFPALIENMTVPVPPLLFMLDIFPFKLYFFEGIIVHGLLISRQFGSKPPSK
jgi:hypothetical protein